MMALISRLAFLFGHVKVTGTHSLGRKTKPSLTTLILKKKNT